MTTYEWCHWIPDAVNSDPKIAERTIYIPGWEDRGRPGSFFPSGELDHHTACMMRLGHDPQTDINVNLKGNSVAPGPISQALITWTPPGVKWNGHNPDPRLIIIAAGRCNHAGATEYRWGAPGGNGSSFGNECCGPSEQFPWPDSVIDLRARWSAAVLRTNGWSIENLTTHNECAIPHGRKIDPSGPWSEEPDLDPLDPWTATTWRRFVGGFLFTPKPNPPVVIPPIATNPTTGKRSLRMDIIKAAPNLPAEQDFEAWFMGHVDQNGIAHTVEWTGVGGDPAVQATIRETIAAGAGTTLCGLGSMKNMVLLGPLPPDGTDIKHNWRSSDFRKHIQ